MSFGVTDHGYDGVVKEVVISDGITGIQENAFMCLDYLHRVSMPSVVEIGSGAFKWCRSLEEIEFSENITTIEDDPFVGSNWLENQDDGEIYIGKVYYKYKGSMESGTEVTIKPGTTMVAAHAFDDCYDSLVSVSIPDSVTSIGYHAFADTGLTSVSLPSGLVRIEECVFYGTNLESVEIPEGVQSIGYGAFWCCENLTTVSLPSTLEEVEDYAFNDTPWFEDKADGDVYIGKTYYCYKGNMPENTTITIRNGTKYVNSFYYKENLAEINFPDSVISIDSFYNCTSLEQITIPSGVNHITENQFKNCTSLSSVVISSGVDEIERYAFLECTSLTNVTFADTSGWHISGVWDDIEEKTIDISINVTNSSTNAINLKNGSWDEPPGYSDYDWKKS